VSFFNPDNALTRPPEDIEKDQPDSSEFDKVIGNRFETTINLLDISNFKLDQPLEKSSSQASDHMWEFYNL
jgi:hypothetical protein